jgi:pimeloyl-ACP methyl ester carboxylesterase
MISLSRATGQPDATAPATGSPATGSPASGSPATQAGPMPEVPGVTHRFVTARGARFHVAHAGPAPSGDDPVVLLHGLPQHWYAWRKVIPELATSHQLFCIDLRGCGWSEGTRRGYGTTAQARDVLAMLDALGLDRVRLIGHETGGWVGFELCLLAPERISGFLALNVSHPWPRKADLVRHRLAVLVHSVLGVPRPRPHDAAALARVHPRAAQAVGRAALPMGRGGARGVRPGEPHARDVQGDRADAMAVRAP